MDRTPPTSLLDFQSRFATEEACEDYFFAWRWPEGFHCPRCFGSEATRLLTRRQYQCRQCRYQVSITAGTALHDSQLSLRIWLWAIFLVARHKKGVSALQLQSDLGLGSYRTAWLLLHKIRACFDECSEFPLRGLVHIDETLVGGPEEGARPGRGAGKKGIVVAAVEVLEDGHMGSARMRVIPNVRAESLTPFVCDTVDKDLSIIATDGWPPYNETERVGYTRERHVARGPRDGIFKPVLRQVHILFTNLKRFLVGRLHGVNLKYLPRHVAEFIYRFNRRGSLPDLLGWVCRRLVERPAVTLATLKTGPAA